ncbi:DNA internalization-related competence protein ComEC/Rec2 [Paraburkholderia antibiotica]|uniref:DNA internalization-related competence protein ComEC/Rec2 n=1 Tax=Paraburkholderia antibiotica TaxID=2728839 RepID=A0A7X9ZWR6_9BURK|nr:DNA internalization-related competence protein ComEC/Rec2 [Paraburkholderia antibiotica]NML29845.1 DNA internalization-related competence protein ComEC/Rec2 [Paraburkholderia antibiotica]
MRAVWCGFALGVIWLQRQAALPEGGGWWALLLAGCVALGVAVWGLRDAAAQQPAGESVQSAAADSQGRRARAGNGYSGLMPMKLRATGRASWLRWQRWSKARLAMRERRPDARVRRAVGWLAVGCAACCIGFGYAAARAQLRLAVSLPHAWEGRDIEVVGSIKGLPSRDDKGARFLFEVDANDAQLAAFPRVIQLSWMTRDAPPPPLEPGERWRLPVRLKRPHGNANFGVRDAEATLLARNVRASGYVSAPERAVRLAGHAGGLGVRVDRWRAVLRARIDTVLADAPHRGIVVALAIGAQDEVSAADWQLMRSTGTSHLVAISGLHIGFVAGLAGWFAATVWRRSGWLGRNWPLRLPAQIVGVTAGALFAALHAALAGFNVPAQRALWMAALAAFAFVGGRQLARSTVFAWALGLVLLIDPWAVVSAGFWLSFGAVGAILFAMSGRPRERAGGSREPATDDEQSGAGAKWQALRAGLMRRGRALAERLRSAAQVQFAVTIALAPLTVYWFSQIPLLGPLANAFAIPWVSLLVTPTVLAGVALPAPLDAFAWRAAHTLLDGLATGLRWLSGPHWALWWLPQPHAWALAAAALGVLWCLAPRGWPLRWAAPLTWLPLLMPGADGALASPAGAFRLTALDVGQGTSVLVQTAHHALLFDAGPGPESTHAGERVVVPFLQAQGVTTLDTLIVSHSDSDHAGGVPAVLDAIGVRQMVAGLEADHPLWSNARRHGAQTLPCAAGQRWQWDGVEFSMLWPDPGPLHGKPNDHCCVLRVRTLPSAVRGPATSVRANDAPAVAALLTADIEAPTERVLLARDRDALRAQVLIVPHHGSRTSSTEPFLDAIGPSVALFQMGYENRFHHPNAGVFARYVARHIELGRSDRDGAVRVDVDPGAHEAPVLLERYRDTRRRYWMDSTVDQPA